MLAFLDQLGELLVDMRNLRFELVARLDVVHCRQRSLSQPPPRAMGAGDSRARRRICVLAVTSPGVRCTSYLPAPDLVSLSSNDGFLSCASAATSTPSTPCSGALCCGGQRGGTHLAQHDFIKSSHHLRVAPPSGRPDSLGTEERGSRAADVHVVEIGECAIGETDLELGRDAAVGGQPWAKGCSEALAGFVAARAGVEEARGRVGAREGAVVSSTGVWARGSPLLTWCRCRRWRLRKGSSPCIGTPVALPAGQHMEMGLHVATYQNVRTRIFHHKTDISLEFSTPP
jgi:hypothetical protein